MKYIGSGFLSCLNSDKEKDWVVWGRRMLNIRFADLLSLKNMNCVYLDTVHVDKSTKRKLSFLLKIYSTLHPYRIEKRITFYLLKIFAKKVVRVHVSLISDSSTWKKVSLKEGGMTLQGLSYKQLTAVIKILVCQIDAEFLSERLSHSELIDFAIKNKVGTTSISVELDSYGVRFLAECLK